MTSGRHRIILLLLALPAALVSGLAFLLRGDVDGSAPVAADSPPSSSPAQPEVSVDDAPAPRATGLPATTPWRAGSGEPQPEVKQTTSEFIETAGTWVDSAGASATLQAAGISPEVAVTAAPLEAPGAVASIVEVVYPQYGGLTADRAAVMILFEQNLQMSDGSRTTRQMALDVRLVRQPSAGWAVERINPLTSLGPAVPLSGTARAVLAEPRLRLSAPARLDVSSGRLDDRLLRVLLGLADEHVLDVQLAHTGHIQTVFPTDRLSNHAVGRAVDIRAVDGSLVVDPATSRDLLTQVMVRAGELGATEVGAPFDLNGERAGFFTDIVHQDHLHIGITPGKPQATR